MRPASVGFRFWRDGFQSVRGCVCGSWRDWASCWMLLPRNGADVTAIRLLEIEIDFGAAVGAAAVGVVVAGGGDVGATGLTGTLGKGDDLGR